MDKGEWSILITGALMLAYFIGVHVGFKGGRGHEQYLAELEKLKQGTEGECNDGT